MSYLLIKFNIINIFSILFVSESNLKSQCVGFTRSSYLAPHFIPNIRLVCPSCIDYDNKKAHLFAPFCLGLIIATQLISWTAYISNISNNLSYSYSRHKRDVVSIYLSSLYLSHTTHWVEKSDISVCS